MKASMINYTIAPGMADVTLYVFIPDASSSVGAGLTGLVYNSTSLVCYYVRTLAAAAQLALATQTVTGAHSDGGFVEIDATNMPGVYRLDLSDAVCAVNVTQAWVELKGAANMVPVLINIKLNNTNADVIAISGDTTAADNCELMFDGTGYAGGTAKLKVDMDTIKTQAITCAAGVTVLASVGTAATSTAQTGDCYPLVSTEVAEIYAAVITNATGADIAADIIAMQGNVTTIMADTDLLDDVSGGLADIHTDVGTLTTTVGAAGAGLTSANIGQAALVANNLDHLCLTATAAADMTVE